MEIANLPKIPVAMNVMLDKRKSKLVNVKGSIGLLDISSFPELTRNVSETQLLALKTAGLLLNYFHYLYIYVNQIFIKANTSRYKSFKQYVGTI